MTTYQPKVGDVILTKEQLAERLAAERRATVERIRERLNGRGMTRWATAAHADDPEAPEWAVDEQALLAILDEEAARV